MRDQTKKRWIWGILISSFVMILACDLGMLIKNRLKPCDLSEQNCQAGYYCSQTTTELKARCLPIPSQPAFSLRPPLESFECLRGHLTSPDHLQDSSAFRLLLASRKGENLVAPAAGKLITLAEASEVRIVHEAGYVSYFFPVEVQPMPQKVEVKEGAVIGKSFGNLSFGIYYVNPSLSSEVHRSPARGFSVPFKLRISSQELSSFEISCVESSKVKLLKNQP